MADSGNGASGASSVFVTATDGLRLHVGCYGSRHAPNVPVVCLPGLTRTTADFDDIATALAHHPLTPRQVLAIDYRGRGLSGYDPNPANYTLATELADLQTILAALDVAPAVFIGTSRGGLLTMLLASVNLTAIVGAVLNDIGPVIEPAGLMRIKNYVGKLPEPKSYEDGAQIFRRLFGQHFPQFTDRDWLAYAHRSFKVEQHKLVPTYDVRLAQSMVGIDLSQPLPTMWPQFDALGQVPLMVIRGQNSDLLSADTVTAMRGRRWTMEAVTVPDQGHAPVLAGAPLTAQIVAFVASCDPRRD